MQCRLNGNYLGGRILNKYSLCICKYMYKLHHDVEVSIGFT